MTTMIPDVDLEACAHEPIHIAGAIQPFGVLLTLDPESLAVLQASANAPELLSDCVILGAPLQGEAEALARSLGPWLRSEERTYQETIEIDGRLLHALAQRADNVVMLEFEESSAAEQRTMERLFSHLRGFAEGLTSSWDLRSLSTIVAKHVRDLTGFDRVLVYRFDRDWNGHVIGEDGNGVLPSYLGLRFPAADIPAQARQLYTLNRLRIIPDVDYRPVPIEPAVNPRTGKPVDLSLSLLRSVSPVHLEYMRNMGTAASMSISIIVEGELWGLVSGHSRAPHQVPLYVRNSCDFAVQALATQIAAMERASEAARRLHLTGIHTRLLAQMSVAADWKRGLIDHGEDFLAQVNASGAAIVAEGDYLSVGTTPSADQVRAIISWLQQSDADVHVTENLAAGMPRAEDFADVASGVLAIRISELHPSWMLWFRPEVVQTVEWGGNPHKLVKEAGRIHPRRSFEAWKQQVRGHSQPWQAAEIAAARDLRAAVVGIVLRRAEELAKLTQELQRSNKELEAFSYSVSHDLRAPFRHIVGYSELLREREKTLDEKSRHYLDSISESAIAAGRLVDDLLNFSHLGRNAIARNNVDMDKLVAEVRRSLALTIEGRDIEWQVDRLPAAWGDATMLRQVWFNLVENAVKYTRPRQKATIAIEGWVDGQETCYAVRDNGVGFDMAYVEKLFGVFQRLQRVEDFEGTGIGLALVRRVVERHNGRIWAEGKVNEGANFYFALPMKQKESGNG